MGGHLSKFASMDLQRASWAVYLGLLTWMTVIVGGSQNANGDLAVFDRLTKTLMKDYNKLVRPTKHHLNATTVTFSFVPLFLIDVSEANHTFTIDAWLRMNWLDERLKWDPKDYSGQKKVTFGDKMIWQPDMTIYNAFAGNVDAMGKSYVVIHNTGHVTWVPPATITTSCLLGENLDRYPHDEHQCDIYFGSWREPGWSVDLQPDPYGTLWMHNFKNSHPLWNVTLVTAHHERYSFNCCTEPWDFIISTVHLQRRPPAELIVSWNGNVIALLLTLAMFWTAPDSGKKIYLGVASLLMLTALMFHTALAVRSKLTTYYAVKPICATLYLATAALLLEIIVLSVGRVTGRSRPPQAIVQLLRGNCGKVFLVWPCQNDGQLRAHSGRAIVDPFRREEVEAQEEWLLVAAVLDRVFFIMFLGASLTLHNTL